MEKAKRFLLVIISAILVIPVINSCKKGDEDPSFSFYSRKHRLCQDWSFSFYKRVEQHNDTTTSYEFDGSSFVKVFGNKSYISSATMGISFDKDGNYVLNEYITTDTSTLTYKEEGSWYFSGGGKDSDTKFKELLILQQNKISQTLQIGSSTTTASYIATGNLESTVFKIIKLASDEVKLKSVTETDNIQSSTTTTDLNILSIEFDLKKNL